MGLQTLWVVTVPLYMEIVSVSLLLFICLCLFVYHYHKGKYCSCISKQRSQIIMPPPPGMPRTSSSPWNIIA